VQAAVAAGLEDLAENRVQEAEAKIGAIGRSAARWHMVGHLQRNKAARAAALFDRIHSVDRIELASSLSRLGVAEGRRLRVLIQVHVSEEVSKHGVPPGELEGLLEQARELPGLVIDGLMSIGPWVEQPEAGRPYFARTRELRDRAERRLGIELPELSMGMSADYEVAIEEGSTLVRVGTALFGPRD
jgi:pyridoxal phosphate enzyme (YggS family)